MCMRSLQLSNNVYKESTALAMCMRSLQLSSNVYGKSTALAMCTRSLQLSSNVYEVYSSLAMCTSSLAQGHYIYVTAKYGTRDSSISILMLYHWTTNATLSFYNTKQLVLQFMGMLYCIVVPEIPLYWFLELQGPIDRFLWSVLHRLHSGFKF